MAPGKRKSPFIGAVETATDPILYKRYMDSSEILLRKDPEEKQAKKRRVKNPAKADGAVAGNGEKPFEEMTREELLQLVQRRNDLANGSVKQQKKAARSSTNADGPAAIGKSDGDARSDQSIPTNGQGVATGSEDLAAPVEGKTARKKKKEKQKTPKAEAKAKVPSGPSNADEADKIRAIMGIKASEETAKTSNGFVFGFSPAVPSESRQADESEESDSQRDSAAALQEEGEDAAAAEKEDNPEEGRQGTEGPVSETKATTDLKRETDSNPHLDAKLKRVLGQKSDLVARRIFVGGMPFTYDEDEVREYWSYCGEIEEVDLMRFPDTGRFKGIAFVTFANEAGYREALKCNGEYIDDHKLKVEPCISAGPKASNKSRSRGESKQKAEHTTPAPKTPGYHVAYVGNLSFEATPNQLREMFEGCEVTVVRLHTDKETGKSKGYAHVHFANEESLDRAVEANGTKLLGRALKIGYAQPKKEQS